jgi:hypothetical protein
LRAVIDASNNNHFTYVTKSMNQNYLYRFSFKYYIPSGQTALGGVVMGIGDGTYTTYANTTDAETEYVAEFIPKSNNLSIYATTSAGGIVVNDPGGDDKFYIKDFHYEKLGCVAQYDGSSATPTVWYDKSGNELNGTVSGAVLFNAQEYLYVERKTDNTTTSADAMTLAHQTSGTPAAGIGVGQVYKVETSANNYENIAGIEALTTDVTAASEDGALVFKVMVNGATPVEAGRIVGNTTGTPAATDQVTPAWMITADADADGSATTNETLKWTLTSNSTPTLATWGLTSTQSAGYIFDKPLQLGLSGTSGKLKMYSEQGGTDYTVSLNPNTAMTSAADFYLPADEPAATSFVTMTSGGVMGFDTEVTGWVDDVTLGSSGALTLPSGQSFSIGSVQWDSATDSINGAVIAAGTIPAAGLAPTVWENVVQSSEVWVTSASQNPALVTLPANAKVLSVECWVSEAFTSDGTDLVSVGYDGALTEYCTDIDVSSTGVKSATLGATAKTVDATSRAVEVYYTNGGSEPGAGKAHVSITWIQSTVSP